MNTVFLVHTNHDAWPLGPGKNRWEHSVRSTKTSEPARNVPLPMSATSARGGGGSRSPFLPPLLPLPLVRCTNHRHAGTDPRLLLGRAARRRHGEQRTEFPPRLFQLLLLLPSLRAGGGRRPSRGAQAAWAQERPVSAEGMSLVAPGSAAPAS